MFAEEPLPSKSTYPPPHDLVNLHNGKTERIGYSVPIEWTTGEPPTPLASNSAKGLALLVGCEAVKIRARTKGERAMSTEENKALSRRLSEEMLNKGNMAAAEALIAEDHRNPYPAPGQEQGRKGVIAGITMFRAAFPDMEWTTDVLVAEGDKVAGAFTMRGTHRGAFQGIPPTGKQVTVRGMAIDTFAAGQCVETRILIDMLSLLQQLGAIPVPGHANAR